MFPLQRWWARILVFLVVASCTNGPESGGEATPPSITTAPNTTVVTTISSVPSGPPSYLVYGWNGVTRVVGGAVTRLTVEPVVWATEDGAGGVVFRSVTEEPGWVWLPSGAFGPVEVFVDEGRYGGVELAALVESRPSVVVARAIDSDTARCEAGDPVVEEMIVRDLQTSQERFVTCRTQSSDIADSWSSYGGGMFTVERDYWVGSAYSSGPLSFVNLSGEDVAVEHNPFAESCAPCELDAHLSPDGSLLALAYWPTAFWDIEPVDGDVKRARGEWWEASKDIPAELVVLDLETGVERWRTEAPARTRLDDFDGRYVTVGTDTGRSIHDSVTGAVLSIPLAQTEPAAFWAAILDSLNTATHAYADAHQVAAEISEEHGVETGVLWSDGWLTLNPGYWAVFTGGYRTRDEAVGVCEDLRPLVGSCYPRHVATAETIDPKIGWVEPPEELRRTSLVLADTTSGPFRQL